MWPPWPLVRSSEGPGQREGPADAGSPGSPSARVRSQVIKLPLVMHGVRLAKTLS